MYLALALLIDSFDLVPEDVVRERDIDFVGDFSSVVLGMTAPV